MPAPVGVESSGTLGEGIYAALSGHYYRYALATLLTIQPDPRNRHSIGLTNVLESMACARPVIATETSAMASEIRLEARGAGRYVAPGDAGSLRAALRRVRDDPEEARAQGLRGRELCEQFFHIDRFADDLHALFDSL
jgi:glycosyltransferase involved in cell wall biosynthesis